MIYDSMVKVNKNFLYDVVVIGGGMSGMLTAIILSKIGLKIALVEKKKFSPPKEDIDCRAISIAPGSVEIMARYGIWEKLYHRAELINHIRVLDNYSSFFLDFENHNINNRPLGYIIEAYFILNGLYDLVLAEKNITIFDQASIVSIISSDKFAKILLDDECEINATLAIAADGKNSSTRQLLGITSVDYNYDQVAMVFACKHKRNHRNIAVEHFMPSGPFAILPLPGGYRSGIVWTERTKIAEEYLKMGKKDFQYFLNAKFTEYLGAVEVDSKIINYPLALKFSNDYFKGRFVLVGDSAHAIHPLAGQGLNLGIRDIGLLASLVEQNKELGLDLASPILLSEYQRARKVDNTLMILMTHGLDRLFSNNYTILKPIRKIGLSVVNKIDRLKLMLMEKAMGKTE